MTIDVYIDNEESEVIDIHDSATLASMTDRELTEVLVAYAASMDNRLAVIEDIHKQILAATSELMSNPMLSMFLPKG